MTLAANRGTGWLAGIGVTLTASAALFAAPAAAAPKPDLKVASVSAAESSVAAGSALSVEDETANVGAARAGRSTTRFYLSLDQERGGGDTRLRGKHAVPALGKDRSDEAESELEVPLTTPAEHQHLIACADDRRKVAERREGNNCEATATTLSVELPADCADRLTNLGVNYEAGPAAPGVADPVTVVPPIEGIAYTSASLDDTLFMDCTLALALHEMAAEMTARGLDEVVHAGIYSYRCISDPGPPPNCPNGISRHAYADAIDILELRSPTDTYNVNDDWVIDSDADPTCAAATSGVKDSLLHSFVCALHAAGTFHIVLTPNYNDAHRNHFHLDLTPDVSFIE